MTTQDICRIWLDVTEDAVLNLKLIEFFAQRIAALEREACIEILSRTEFTSLEHMPSEAALIIRARADA